VASYAHLGCLRHRQCSLHFLQSKAAAAVTITTKLKQHSTGVVVVVVTAKSLSCNCSCELLISDLVSRHIASAAGGHLSIAIAVAITNALNTSDATRVSTNY